MLTTVPSGEDVPEEGPRPPEPLEELHAPAGEA
jgi:hypothetical protein